MHLSAELGTKEGGSSSLAYLYVPPIREGERAMGVTRTQRSLGR